MCYIYPMDKPRGRPPLPPGQRRSRTVLVSMTETEFRHLSLWAARENVLPSRFVRKALDLAGVLLEPPAAIVTRH